MIGLLLTVCVIAASDAPSDPKPLLLVANKHDDTLDFIDPDTLEVLETIPTGPNPHEIVLTPDQRFAYLSNYAPPGNTISVIDLVQPVGWVKQSGTHHNGVMAGSGLVGSALVLCRSVMRCLRIV